MDDLDAIIENEQAFREDVYELAFGDNAINRDFTDEEVIAKLKEFSNDAWLYEKQKELEV